MDEKSITKRQLEYVCDGLSEQIVDADLFIGDIGVPQKYRLTDDDKKLLKIVFGNLPDLIWKHI